jgi:hypothetical protein
VAAAQYNGMWEGLGLGDLDCEVAGARGGRAAEGGRESRRGRVGATFQFFPVYLCTLMFFYFEILYNSKFFARTLIPT